ncbi:hypothetical protein QVD17_25830 [Tagetes erecta]|uniref:Uncharacterized protein n=1 Tax=Tagetes erecta TaxID=13708 RepID=A0AAD8K6D1_TARER|nr:hypothetical protein QVD17_25830 [Tagetes erecta]
MKMKMEEGYAHGPRKQELAQLTLRLVEIHQVAIMGNGIVDSWKWGMDGNMIFLTGHVKGFIQTQGGNEEMHKFPWNIFNSQTLRNEFPHVILMLKGTLLFN